MEIYLALGSNLGDKEGFIKKAIEEIGNRVGTILAQSSFYYSKPQGFVSDNDFVNAVICCDTAKTPHEVLLVTQEIEKELGRTKKSTKESVQSSSVAFQQMAEYSDRTIDIDILLWGNQTIDEPDLKVPHPRMNERDFVLVPLNEILNKR